MSYLKKIMMVIGFVVTIAIVIVGVKFYPKVSQLDSKAIGLYMKMFSDVLDSGNAGDAMVYKAKVKKGISIEDVEQTLIDVAEENNMLFTGGKKMPISNKNLKYVKIMSFCSPYIANKFLNHAKSFGAFMPCRVIIIKDGSGDVWLYTMSLDLLISGGKTLPPEMLKMAKSVRYTMYKMVDDAASGEF